MPRRCEPRINPGPDNTHGVMFSTLLLRLENGASAFYVNRPLKGANLIGVNRKIAENTVNSDFRPIFELFRLKSNI